jgi:hypothetical protein
MTAVLAVMRRSRLWSLLRALWLRFRHRRRTPVRALALAGFCLVVAVIVGTTLTVFNAGRGGILIVFLVGLFTIATVLRPEGVAATVVLVLMTAAYLYGTTLAGDGNAQPDLLPVLGLAVALFLAHALVALAAAIPPGATVEPAVLHRWLRRVVEVVAVTVPVGLVVWIAQQWDAPEPVRVVGYVLVVGIVAVAISYGRGKAPWRD